MKAFQVLSVLSVIGVGGCAQIETALAPNPELAEPEETRTPEAAPQEAVIGVSGVTAAALDTTTTAERAAAVSEVDTSARVLGRSVASLGSPTDPGLWLSTNLVGDTQQGQVTYLDTGETIQLELRPLDQAGGAQMSLSAFRLLNAPLTDLVEVEISLLN